MDSNEICQFDIDDFYSNEDGLLGTGGFGKVFLSKHKKHGFLIVKFFDRRKNRTQDSTSQKRSITKDFDKESKSMWNVNHENVIKLHGTVEWTEGFGIVMEYARCGNLDSLLHEEKDLDISWFLRLKFLMEIITGVIYLHSQKKLEHGDLKPQNILLSDQLQAKIADLGSARLLDTKSEKVSGTVGFTAPEIYDGEQFVSTYSDIYSYAIIAYEIVTRNTRMLPKMGWMPPKNIAEQPPVRQLDEAIEALSQNSKHRTLLGNLKTMIKSCWCKEPTDRWSASAILKKLEEWLFHGGEKKYSKKLEAEILETAETLKQRPYDEASEYPLRNLLQNPNPSNNRVGPSLIIIGGQASKRDAVQFTPLPSNEWKELPKLNNGRCHHCSVVAKNELFVMGGTDRGNVLKSVECLNMKEPSEWLPLPDMNVARFLASAEIMKDHIYILGGKDQNDEILDSVEIFDVSSKQWSLAHVKLQEKWFNFSTFIYNSNIYCCGGEDSKGKPLLKVEKISFEDANEKNLCPVQEDEKKFARFGASAVKGGEEQTVFLLGGRGNSQKTAEKTVVSYSVDAGWKLKSKCDMEMRRCSFAAAVIHPTIYVLGGHGLNNKQGSLTTYERWDMSKKSKKTWSLESIPDPEERNWAGHSMVVCNLML